MSAGLGAVHSPLQPALSRKSDLMDNQIVVFELGSEQFGVNIVLGREHHQDAGDYENATISELRGGSDKFAR